MYLPKNKIITNLYTNGGEFVNKTTKSSYQGFYHKLYNGKVYTGKTPTDGPVVELEKMLSNPNKQPNISQVALTPDNNIINNKLWDYQAIVTYQQAKDQQGANPKIIPDNYIPVLTDKEYKVGEFQRYFVKKINESLFKEISKDDYNNLKQKDDSYLYEMFLLFSYSWLVTGNRVEAYQTNQKTILLTEQKYNIQIPFNNYLEYYMYPVRYDLYTEGSELTLDRNNYIGYYNIDNKKGFITKEGIILTPVDEDVLWKKILNNTSQETVKLYDSIKKK